MHFDTFTTSVELKFIDDGAPGTFEGYGAVYGNVDSHKDVIAPGAFDETLAKHKAAGTMPALHAEHDWAMGGDPLPGGVWTSLESDGMGLRGKGKISALDTDYGKRLHSLMRDGAMKGLSIVYSIPPGGSERLKKSDGARLLKQVELHAIDIVKFPSNSAARIDAVKGILRNVDVEKIAKAAAAGIMAHSLSMKGNDSPTTEERNSILTHFQDIHEVATGKRMPDGMKAIGGFSTVREFEAFLRDEAGYTNSQARLIAESGFKALAPRDEADGEATKAAVKELFSEFADGLHGLSNLSF